MHTISVVVLNYNDYETTQKFVSSIADYRAIEHIVIVDNCSTDDSFEILSDMASDKIDVIKTTKNGGYGYGNNIGVKYLIDNYGSSRIAISNPDVEISENTVERCLSIFDTYPKCAVVAPMMKNPNGEKNYQCVWRIPSFMQYAFFSLIFLGIYGKRMYYDQEQLDNNKVLQVGCVAGSFFIVDAERFLLCGGFDESIFLFCEETVLGIRLNNLKLNSYLVCDAFFIHHHSVSINKSISSLIIQHKMMWKSREYVLKNYYKNDRLRNGVIFFSKSVSIFENRLNLSVKNLKRKLRINE